MNKKISHTTLLAILLSFASFSLVSCDDDDVVNNAIDEEWKAKNETEFKEAASSGEYKKEYTYSSTTIPGSADEYILYKTSTIIGDSDDKRTKIASNGTAEFTDSIQCRYEGWYFDKNNKKYIFESTENPTTGSIAHPNKVPIGISVKEIIEGWRTALQVMREGDELEIIIPQTLAYGANPKYDKYGKLIIPGYTTLYFRIKLVEIIQMKGTN